MLTVLIMQGLAFGLIVTVSPSELSSFVAADRKGISTALQVFSRNIGSAVGVTIMGALLTTAPAFMTGIRRLSCTAFSSA